MALVELARTVRFSVNPAAHAASSAARTSRNTYAGSPAMLGLGAYYELTVRCRGTPDPVTGYLRSQPRSVGSPLRGNHRSANSQ